MSNKIEQIRNRVKDLEKEHEDLVFPQFLEALRKAHNLTRRALCKELGLPELRMFWVEKGFFRTPLPLEMIEKLASFYGIDSMVLLKKELDFFSLPNFKEVTTYKAKKPRKKV